MIVGNYSAAWKGSDDCGKQFVSGFYFISLESQAFIATKKMIFMKKDLVNKQYVLLHAPQRFSAGVSIIQSADKFYIKTNPIL